MSVPSEIAAALDSARTVPIDEWAPDDFRETCEEFLRRRGTRTTSLTWERFAALVRKQWGRNDPAATLRKFCERNWPELFAEQQRRW